MSHRRRILILAEGRFSPLGSKTANQAIRYIPEEIVGVIDSQNAGKTVQQVLGFGGTIPVFPDLHNALITRPDTLLIGIAPTGGKLPESWRKIIIETIENRLNIINGLHTFLSDDNEFRYLAQMYQVNIFDLRKISPEYFCIAKGSWKTRTSKTILTVGSDCNVGKMTASLELHREFLRRGLNSDFVATGQTGILLSGRGIAVDAIVSDYVAGAIEREIDSRVMEGKQFLHVEGQGSLTHQGYSGVTLSLMHGVMPDAMVMVHHPIRHKDDYGFSIDNLKMLIDLHESILSPFKSSKVVAVAINTINMTPRQVEQSKNEIEAQTGLPVGDVLSQDVKMLADALLKYLDR